MEKLPRNWTERIFERMKWIFKEKWTDAYERSATRKDLYMTQWSSGLSGLTAKEIQRAITILECFRPAYVPSVVDFYHYAKGNTQPQKQRQYDSTNVSSPATTKHYITEIKNKLSGKPSGKESYETTASP